MSFQNMNRKGGKKVQVGWLLATRTDERVMLPNYIIKIIIKHSLRRYWSGGWGKGGAKSHSWF